MKRIALMFCSVLVGLLAMAGTANAQPTAAVVNCQHGSTYGTVVSAAHVMRYDKQVALGAIQLCTDGSGNYWSFVIFYDPMPIGNWGYAYLNRYLDGKYVDSFGCNSPGGNGHVARGQTRCWTPKIYAPSSRVTFTGVGTQCEGTVPHCAFRQGHGQTARTR